MAQALELGNRPHVVVATPGRIVDLLKSTSGEWDLSRVKFLVCGLLQDCAVLAGSSPIQVLDEADRLLTPSFAPELSCLFETLPKERQTCLFTATLTPAVERVADAPPKPGKQKPFVHRMTAPYVFPRLKPIPLLNLVTQGRDSGDTEAALHPCPLACSGSLFVLLPVQPSGVHTPSPPRTSRTYQTFSQTEGSPVKAVEEGKASEEVIDKRRRGPRTTSTHNHILHAPAHSSLPYTPPSKPPYPRDRPTFPSDTAGTSLFPFPLPRFRSAGTRVYRRRSAWSRH